MNKINNIEVNDINKLYDSLNYGKFKIIDSLNNRGKNKYYKVQFINTGNIYDFRKDHILEGSIKDIIKIDFNRPYKSKRNGEFLVLYETKDRYYRIKFINTGYEKDARKDHILSGNVIDDSIPQVYNIGTYGDNIDYHAHKHEYNVWNSMISRCYNKNNNEYHNYGGCGVKVCDRWLTFSNFYYDLPYLLNYDLFISNKFQLDKDYKQINIIKSNRIYSPETCIFLPIKSNLLISRFDNSDNYNLSILYIGIGYEVIIKINNIVYSYGIYNNYETANYVLNNIQIQMCKIIK